MTDKLDPRLVDFILVSIPMDDIVCTSTDDCDPDECACPEPCSEDIECNEGHVNLEALQKQAETLGATQEASKLAFDAKQRAAAIKEAVVDLVTRLEAFEAVSRAIDEAAKGAKVLAYDQIFGDAGVPIAIDVIVDAGLIYAK